MGEFKEMGFYDSKEIVLGKKRVTLRLAKKSNDKYDNFQAGDPFVLKIVNDFDHEKVKRGLILGHWKLPFALIPAEFLAGEAYDLQLDCEEDQYETIEWLLRTQAKDDLSSYYTITDLSDVHIFVYSPKEDVDEQFIQLPNEDPQEWIERCGGSVLGHIEEYNKLRECLEQ